MPGCMLWTAAKFMMNMQTPVPPTGSSLFTADDFEWTATPRKLLLRIAAAARRKKPCHHAGQPRFSELLAVRAAGARGGGSYTPGPAPPR